MFEPEEEAGEIREENSVPEIGKEFVSGINAEERTTAAPEAARRSRRGESGEQGYSDAHYEPAEESTVPPRYYCPPERPERPAKEPRERTRDSGTGLKILSLVLIFCLLGGLVAGMLSIHRLNSRIDALEAGINANTESIAAVIDREHVVQAVGAASGTGLPAGQIYDLSCEQVVGISMTVTTQNFFGMTVSSPVSGSGFILSEDGYILTNYHVIEYAADGRLPITVMTRDGTQYEASIVGTEEANDIAVLKIDATGLNPVSFGDSDAISVGDVVYAVGNPLGELEFSMSTGHVSALDRVISTEEAEAINMFQIDAAVNPGNSGGPVYNDRGQVIGVVTAKYSDAAVEGLGFAIPINDAASIAEDLITKGYVTGKAYMGVWLDERYSAMYAQYYNMPLGAYISAVDSGTAAERAGLQAGDIITQLGDTEIASYADLKAAIRQFSAGDTAQITFYRAGESRTVGITFDESKPASATD